MPTIVYAMGEGPTGDGWQVGVRSPQDPDRLLTTVRVTDRAVATSGSHLQYFESSGRRYDHLIDPATAAPRVCGMRSLTVAAADCVTADAAATALFGRDPGAAAGILAARAPGAGVVLAI